MLPRMCSTSFRQAPIATTTRPAIWRSTSTRARVYGYSLVADNLRAAVGDGVSIQIKADVLQGNATATTTFARMVSPVNDITAMTARLNPRKINPDELNRDQRTPKFDAAMALARLERKSPKVSAHRDEQMTVVAHHDGPLHVHIEQARAAGPHHLAVYIEGDYCPDHDTAAGSHSHDHAAHAHAGGARSKSTCDQDCVRRAFFKAPDNVRAGHRVQTADGGFEAAARGQERAQDKKQAGKPKHRR